MINLTQEALVELWKYTLKDSQCLTLLRANISWSSAMIEHCHIMEAEVLVTPWHDDGNESWLLLIIQEYVMIFP